MAIGISMITFSETPTLSVVEIQKNAETLWSDFPATTDAEEKDITIAFKVGLSDVIIGLMPVPIPWGDLEGPCATSILWPDASTVLKSHKEHAIVTVSGELDPIALSTLLTQATVAVLATSPVALGVYWGNAALVVPKEIFIDFATKIMPLGPPLDIWVDFRVGKNEKKSCSGFTTGMIALGHMEFETENATGTPGELRERFSALASYVLENGPVIKDGDTVGEDANEKVKVVFSDSAFGNNEQVMRLEYESTLPKKSKWKFW